MLEGEAHFVSVRARTIFTRCQRAFRPFNSDEAAKLCNARNEYLHGATPGFTNIPEDGWWPLFWRQAVILNGTINRDIADLVGGDREDIVEHHLDQNRKNIEHRTEMLIEQARTRLKQHHAGSLPAKIAKQWSPGVSQTAGLRYTENAHCPACGETGMIEGEDVQNRSLEHHQVDEQDWDTTVELTIYSEYFSCSNCRLILDRPELLDKAGIDSTLAVDGSEDYIAHLEPEYGND